MIIDQQNQDLKDNYNLGDVQDYTGKTKTLTYFMPKESKRTYSLDPNGTLEMICAYMIPSEEIDVRGMFLNGSALYSNEDTENSFNVEMGLYIVYAKQKVPQTPLEMIDFNKFIKFKHLVKQGGQSESQSLQKHRMILFTKEKIKRYTKNGKAGGIYMRRLRGERKNPTLTLLHEDRIMYYRIITVVPTTIKKYQALRDLALPVNLSIISRKKMNEMSTEATQNLKRLNPLRMEDNLQRTKEIKHYLTNKTTKTINKKDSKEKEIEEGDNTSVIRRQRKKRTRQENTIKDLNAGITADPKEDLRLITEENIAKEIVQQERTKYLSILCSFVLGIEHK